MDRTFRMHSGYFERAYGDIDEIAAKMREALESVDYDTMVGTGLSGTLVVPTLARTNGTYWAIVRKEYSEHSGNLIEGEIGNKWIFVDDFISSGATLRRVQGVIKEQIAGFTTYDAECDEWLPFPTEYVGAYLYERNVYEAR